MICIKNTLSKKNNTINMDVSKWPDGFIWMQHSWLSYHHHQNMPMAILMTIQICRFNIYVDYIFQETKSATISGWRLICDNVEASSMPCSLSTIAHRSIIRPSFSGRSVSLRKYQTWIALLFLVSRYCLQSEPRFV